MSTLAELARGILNALEKEDYQEHFMNDMYIKKIKARDARRNS